jgi:hypothetical protein
MELLYMTHGAGYMSPKGVRFTKEHPYQLVDESEVSYLLSEGRFRPATKEDLKEFYNV